MTIIKAINKLFVFSVTCTFLLQACSNTEEKTKLSDSEVAYVAVTANQIDIEYAEIAKEKSVDSAIIKFANTMENDHKAVIGQASDLVKKLGVTPLDNATGQKLLADAAKTKELLRSKSGNEFNKAYIDNEVAYHKAVIETVESVLIPETDNQELKQLLQNVIPALKSHLMHAEMLQKNY